jgi:hypothetical protein
LRFERIHSILSGVVVRLLRRCRVLGLGSVYALLGPVGCAGPSPLPSYPHQGSSGSTSSATSGPIRTSSSDTELADDTGTTTSPDPTGVIFLNGAPDTGLHFECDIFEQDCPAGEKCMPWAYDGGDVLNATKCSPVVDDPARIDEPCHVERSPTSGIDDCSFGAMCWSVDPETLEGICLPFCVGDESNPHCEDPDRVCPITSNGTILLCFSVCSPLQQDCPKGQACYPVQDSWECAADASGELGGYGDPCEFINVCDPGLICLDSDVAVPPGEACEGSTGCCSEVCDLTDPAGDLQCAGAPGGQTCQPWYEEGSAPPGFENVGACALPT